ncbi:6-phosphofructo-2-kinase-domain-containing protein [Gaertneriomyces semiglobifer]|nr:6-phosphofructo-2-kinase-domain-containing protein [Gaertneriomyces semiglobifer]
MALGSTTSSTDKPDSIIKPPPPPPSDISDSTTSTHDIPTITTTHSDSSFVVTPTPQASYKPLSIARLLISKHSPLPTLPVPEPTPSPILHAPAGSTTHDAHFFDPDNPAAKAVREKLAMETLEEIFEWLREGGKVAIHDATNSTRERRRMLLERTRREKGVKGVFIESICTDKDILQNNIEMKLQGPDYKNIPREQAMKDFVARTENYERAYETVGETEEEDLSYIKLINVGRTVVTHNVHGYLESQCVFYLMQMHIDARTIYLTRHGESTYNLSGRIGGDPPLTPHGRKYAAALARFMKSLHPVEENTKRDTLDTTTTTQSIAGQSAIPQSTTTTQGATPQSTPFDRQPSDLVDDNFGGTSRKTGLSVWTSTLLRATQTVEYFPDTHYDTRRIKFLNEIYAGTCEDLTYKEIATLYPDEYQARQSNKLLYRYPGNGGESYVDVIERLRPIIIELERMRSNVLIVTHRVVLRTLLAYFVGVPLEEMTRMEVPLHCLWCLRPKPYGADLVKYKYNAETDWFDEIGTTV